MPHMLFNDVGKCSRFIYNTIKWVSLSVEIRAIIKNPLLIYILQIFYREQYLMYL